VTVRRIVVAEEDARAVFGGVAPLRGPGAWTTSGDALVWTGNVTVRHDAPLDLAFLVTGGAHAAPAGERAAFVPTVRIGEHQGRLLQETAPGMYRGVFLPAGAGSSGYNASLDGSAVRATHAIESSAVHRTTALPGRADYHVSRVAGLQDSAFGSAVGAERRSVEPGQTARLQVDVQSIVYRLAALGLTPSIELLVHPPWATDARAPLAKVPVYNGTLAKGDRTFLSLVDTDGDLRPDPTGIGRHAVEVPIAKHWLYGAYVVEARVTWLERVSGIANGAPLAEDVVRSASVYDYIVVKPSGQEMPASALYDVHLVAWMGDWH
ncbi:MAG TPA: hypothetical protein VM582_04335, partial [Candidatus Thermoplasmatota archaeon]|nr:hypothetical protein [Candidatus Thermoplasmatota archaeon]